MVLLILVSGRSKSYFETETNRPVYSIRSNRKISLKNVFRPLEMSKLMITNLKIQEVQFLIIPHELYQINDVICMQKYRNKWPKRFIRERNNPFNSTNR